MKATDPYQPPTQQPVKAAGMRMDAATDGKLSGWEVVNSLSLPVNSQGGNLFL